MTNGAQPQQKKGISPIAWIAIGCVGLIVIAGIAITTGGLFVAKKGKEFAEEMQENPAKKMAEMAIRVNREYELVETDDEAGTITYRNKETGEEATMNFQDIADGKFSVTTEDGETSTISMGSEGVRAESSGSQDGGGSSSLNIFGGGSDTGNVPERVIYDRASDVSVAFAQKSAAEMSGMINFNTDDGLDEVVAWYEEEFDDCTVNRVDMMGIRNATLECPGGNSVTLTFSGSDGDLGVMVNYSLESGG